MRKRNKSSQGVRKALIYLDNGATSYPKPPNVLSSSMNALKNFSFNSGRGGYSASVNAAEKIYSVRERIGNMFNFEPQNVCIYFKLHDGFKYGNKGKCKKKVII